MRDYFIRRFLLIFPTLLGITLVVFFVSRVMPGGPLEQALMSTQMRSMEAGHSQGKRAGQGSNITPQQRKQLEALYGYDKPWYVAYAHWLGKVVRGDLGKSFRYQTPVWDMIKQRLPISMYYGFVTLILTYSICIPL
ncbi:MAG TPA: ABC transporter permease, partial [Opitutales bacterium]|nr:ABC transporter permease [Opitutales bacterium]